MDIAKLFLLGRGIDVRPQRERLIPQSLARTLCAKYIHSYHIYPNWEKFFEIFSIRHFKGIPPPAYTVVLLRSWLQK